MMPLLALFLFSFLAAAQTGEQAIVQAILFYSPTCPHCHQVITGFLIPMQEEYGEQLQIVGVDISHPAGSYLYGLAIEHFQIPGPRQGVPMLVIEDTVLVGGMEIPDQFPAMVEEGLSAGGVGWPDIPGLSLTLPNLPPSAGAESQADAEVPVAAESGSVRQDPTPVAHPTIAPDGEAARETGGGPTAYPLAQGLGNVNGEAISTEGVVPPADPVGFALAAVVMSGMVVALIYTGRVIVRPSAVPTLAHNLSWTVPALALLGMVVALYLSYVEVNQVEAVCGPVGECNIVQSSPYARLMGIPVAILGALSYMATIVLWLGQRWLPNRLGVLFLVGLVALALIGTGFSIYLTALELFTIKAICAWCLSSAVITTLLLVLVARSLHRGSLRVIVAMQPR
jgi:uncharacterized membrane protein/thiol-disulfide isomerase/thioredoxin